ncbi:hypothetical protein ACQP1W_16460 [Spirillospora sp. CA-255316]
MRVRPAAGSGLDGGGARLVSAAFATVNDALTRRAPEAAVTGQVPEQAGLRGGRLTLERGTPSVRLEGARFVSDLAVTGRATFAAGNRATAEVRADVDGRSVTLGLAWTTHRPENATRVTGTLDGRPFHALVPIP